MYKEGRREEEGGRERKREGEGGRGGGRGLALHCEVNEIFEGRRAVVKVDEHLVRWQFSSSAHDGIPRDNAGLELHVATRACQRGLVVLGVALETGASREDRLDLLVHGELENPIANLLSVVLRHESLLLQVELERNVCALEVGVLDHAAAVCLLHGIADVEEAITEDESLVQLAGSLACHSSLVEDSVGREDVAEAEEGYTNLLLHLRHPCSPRPATRLEAEQVRRLQVSVHLPLIPSVCAARRSHGRPDLVENLSEFLDRRQPSSFSCCLGTASSQDLLGDLLVQRHVGGS
mmetsp:Transcript_19193/g.63400  ORF Transcript_19193/g.63400 Transcript_19193/m.63400 type:complete len:293 (+) Transcript_19193:663-1541(+)